MGSGTNKTPHSQQNQKQTIFHLRRAYLGTNTHTKIGGKTTEDSEGKKCIDLFLIFCLFCVMQRCTLFSEQLHFLDMSISIVALDQMSNTSFGCIFRGIRATLLNLVRKSTAVTSKLPVLSLRLTALNAFFGFCPRCHRFFVALRDFCCSFIVIETFSFDHVLVDQSRRETEMEREEERERRDLNQYAIYNGGHLPLSTLMPAIRALQNSVKFKSSSGQEPRFTVECVDPLTFLGNNLLQKRQFFVCHAQQPPTGKLVRMPQLRLKFHLIVEWRWRLELLLVLAYLMYVAARVLVKCGCRA